jgi:hypothetical protein
MKHGGVRVCVHSLITSALDGVEWSASRPGRFTTEERTAGTCYIEGCVGQTAGVLFVEGSKASGVETQPSDTVPTTVSRISSLKYVVTNKTGNTYVSKTNKMALHSLYLFQLYRPGDVSNKQVRHQEVTSVQAAYSIRYMLVLRSGIAQSV